MMISEALQMIGCFFMVIIMLLSFAVGFAFFVTVLDKISSPRSTRSSTMVETTISNVLETEEGREAIARAMVEPYRRGRREPEQPVVSLEPEKLSRFGIMEIE